LPLPPQNKNKNKNKNKTKVKVKTSHRTGVEASGVRRTAILTSGGSHVYTLSHLPTDLTTAMTTLHSSLSALGSDASYAEARDHVTQKVAAWYPHQSQWGPTKRVILTAVADVSKVDGYGFSGKKSPACQMDWIKGMQEVADALQKIYNAPFGMAHCNKYDTSVRAELSWHADEEKQFLKHGPIVCISFGAPQRVQLRAKGTTEIAGVHVTEHMSIYAMCGTMQETHEHRITTATKVQAAAAAYSGSVDPTVRYSATFRVLDM
jgi:alkylated DNA repair dioxygenase AlkB